jgi:hypothetical protein
VNRYATRHESAKDRLTYHALVFVEWDHRHFGSVVELAWKGGVGGYQVKPYRPSGLLALLNFTNRIPPCPRSGSY